MQSRRDVIVLVGAYHNGWQLIPAFTGRGYACLHIDVAPGLARQHSYDLCIGNLRASGSPATLASHLARYTVRAVIGASGPGIELADRLASYFPVARNDHLTTAFRKNTFLMNEALRINGIPHARQFASAQLEELLDWYRNSGLARVVMKPAVSAFSRGAGICTNADEITTIFTENQGRMNTCGYGNDTYLLQEYLDGPHFRVTTVSCGGDHFVAHILADTEHTPEGTLNSYARTLERESDLFGRLEAYVFRVLDAVGVRNGACHTDVRVTWEGIRLVEVNAWIGGELFPSVMEDCCGFSEISLLTDAVLQPDLFAERTRLCARYPQKQAVLVYLHAPRPVKIRNEPNPSIFAELPSYRAFRSGYSRGDVIRKTEKMDTVPGCAMFLLDKGASFDEEFRRFRVLEQVFYRQMEGTSHQVSDPSGVPLPSGRVPDSPLP